MLVSACQFGGLNSLNMPGTQGHGRGSFSLTVELPDVAALPQNSPVLVNDVAVGSVSGLQAVQRADGTVYAAVTLSLNGNVHLPANATAKVGQTSLLGSQHVELAAPTAEPPVGALTQDSVIPLAHTGRYPTTEEVLSSLGVVVNKGNLGALQDITDEAYAAVAGRAGQFTDLVPRLAEFTRSIAAQTGDIIAAADGVNRFAEILARNTDKIGRALDTLPEVLTVLNNSRQRIIDAFAALQKLANITSKVAAGIKVDFGADLKDLYPVVKSLTDYRENFVTALQQLVTYPFVGKYIKRAARGDYLNVFVTFDLTLRRLGESLFTTSALDDQMKHLSEVVNPPEFIVGDMANLSGQAADPFKIPPGTVSTTGTGP
ncbi:MCE family protein [Mycobacterium sp. 3519A]|uniref:MCE family protein n=1 Tax=Mycobacterium sp. 3519A TaxID=2057184 RepID=UPI000C7A8E0A|nr:MCE family protein [Mycobacterium sp. 3519A]